jgi:hypothetical protein
MNGMDWASNKPGELHLPDVMMETRDSAQIEAHWVLSATGIWDELRQLEEEQTKLQRTLQDVLRRRQMNYSGKPEVIHPAGISGISGKAAMTLAAGLAFCGFILLTLLFSGKGVDMGALALGGYISAVGAVLAGALFAN